jgi:signal transduction histidine kinase/ActR/RegA family two-component response regulator
MEKLRVKPDSILGKWTPYLVLLVALILTVCATAYLAHSFQVKERERFENEVRAVTNRLSERMDTYTELLRGTRGLTVAANGRPSLAQFRAYTRSLELEQSFPGIQGIGFARRSDRADLPHLVAEMRGLGFEKYNVRPSGPRSEYFPIVYLEPEDQRNVTALGFDMFVESVRRAAMVQARDRGEPALSGRVVLVQEIDPVKQFGFLLYLPVYRKDRPTSTVEQRRAALLGFVYSPFRVDDLFQAILGPPENRNILVEVFDGASTADDQVLYGSESRLRALAGDRFVGTRELFVAEHRWTLRFRTAPRFDRSTSTAVIPLAFTGGLAISALLFALTLTQSRQREQAVRVSQELWRTGEALREASRAKDEFLAMLGHELRNPLGAISNALQVMAAREISDPHLRHARSVIERQIRHQTRLIEDLLDVSRVNSGKISLRHEPVELKEVVSRAVEGLQWAVEEQQHHLTVQLPEEELWVKGDAVRLEQIVTNLLHNAIKYTPGGGGVELTLQAEGDEAVLRVRDTGVGISPEMLERIFDVFTQAQTSIDRSKGGLGLGLTLVRNLVRMHGGSVSAASLGIGRGSEFIIRLPEVCRPSEAPEPGGPVSGSAAGPGLGAPASAVPGSLPRRILIVEDIKDARETLQELLELQGYDVEIASDGPEGLAKLLAEPPDVALIDIGLPGLSGYDVASRARAAGKTAGVRLIALTGYGQPEDRARALDAGFDLHVVKPIDPVELERLLRASWSDRSLETKCE